MPLITAKPSLHRYFIYRFLNPNKSKPIGRGLQFPPCSKWMEDAGLLTVVPSTATYTLLLLEYTSTSSTRRGLLLLRRGDSKRPRASSGEGIVTGMDNDSLAESYPVGSVCHSCQEIPGPPLPHPQPAPTIVLLWFWVFTGFADCSPSV